MSDSSKNCCETCTCETTSKSGNSKNIKVRVGDSGIGWLGFWAYVGAAIYFVSQANDFWGGALGFLKALIWPAYLVYQGLLGSHV